MQPGKQSCLQWYLWWWSDLYAVHGGTQGKGWDESTQVYQNIPKMVFQNVQKVKSWDKSRQEWHDRPKEEWHEVLSVYTD